MNYNANFDIDLREGIIKEKEIESILRGTIEVKSDSWTRKTGNICVEYRSRGKDSGIRTTEADWWLFNVLDSKGLIEYSILIPTLKLQQITEPLIAAGRTKDVGDSNTSKSVLIPLDELLNFRKK